MRKDELIKIIDILEGPNPGRSEIMIRNGRWGTCVCCPWRDGKVYPENCQYTERYDHNLPVASATLAIIELLKPTLEG